MSRDPVIAEKEPSGTPDAILISARPRENPRVPGRTVSQAL